jgi:hypothetical protein
MDTKDYRIIVTLATSLAQPCIYNGRTAYELDVAKFINALDNIYPDICIPVSLNGVVLNPNAESEEEE